MMPQLLNTIIVIIQYVNVFDNIQARWLFGSIGRILQAEMNISLLSIGRNR